MTLAGLRDSEKTNVLFVVPCCDERSLKNRKNESFRQKLCTRCMELRPPSAVTPIQIYLYYGHNRTVLYSIHKKNFAEECHHGDVMAPTMRGTFTRRHDTL
jgi:hypothetical protein